MIKTSAFISVFICLISNLTQSQITNFKEKFELPEIVKETSGLLFLDGKIITHNDSGDSNYLYELDSLTGVVLRTITIKNATHIDWEDITEDETYLYISDSGNNNGNRKDLKIYRILKTDFKNNNEVSADIISFSYEDQSNFNSSNSHNFDAEALVVYENNFLIFTKNRGDLKTNVYQFPVTIGTHIAKKVSSANVQGLITGATLQNNNFILCGIDTTTAIPFLVYIGANRAEGNDIFNAGFSKYSLVNELSFGSQVEGITGFDEGRFYISREYVSVNNFTFKQKLFEFRDDSTNVLSILKNNFTNLNIYPNPTSGNLSIQSQKEISLISIYTTLGKKVLEINSHPKEINIATFSKGIYLVKIKFKNSKTVIRKITKY